MSERILVCFAVPQEAAPFRKRVGKEDRIQILVTGMGEKNTRDALLREWGRDSSTRWKAVITSGFAGGLNAQWSRGDVLVWSRHDPLKQAFTKAGAHPGRFTASDRILIHPEEKRKAAQSSGCDAVEMESSTVHRLCEERGIPAATVRVISDAWNDSLPLDFNALLDERKQLPLVRILGAVMRRPGSIPGLMRLGKHSGQAAKRLSDVLDVGVRGLL